MRKIVDIVGLPDSYGTYFIIPRGKVAVVTDHQYECNDGIHHHEFIRWVRCGEENLPLAVDEIMVEGKGYDFEYDPEWRKKNLPPCEWGDLEVR